MTLTFKKTSAARIIRIASVGTVTLGFLLATTPDAVPAVFLLVPFVGLYIFLYLILLEFIRLLGPDEDENGAIVHVRRPRVLSAVLGGFPVLLLVLQSVVELTWWDVLIATLILTLAYVYVVRGSLLIRKR